MAAALLSGALLAGRGGTVWILRLGWGALLIRLLTSSVSFGLFEGGIVLFPVLFTLIAGFVSSLLAKRAVRFQRRFSRKS